MDAFTIRIRYQNAVVIGATTVNAPGVTEWVCFTSRMVVQITGLASHIRLRIERSSMDPKGDLGANPAPADKPGVDIMGDPSAGMAPVAYLEPAVGWWRAVVTEVTGEAMITMSGHHGAGQANPPGVFI